MEWYEAIVAYIIIVSGGYLLSLFFEWNNKRILKKGKKPCNSKNGDRKWN